MSEAVDGSHRNIVRDAGRAADAAARTIASEPCRVGRYLDFSDMSRVAVANSNPEIAEMLRLTFERAGFEVVSVPLMDIRRGAIDFVAFIQEHDPEVLVYDVLPPYAESWNFLHLIRDSEVMRDRPIVITTTNRAALEKMVGAVDAHEIVGKPSDLEEIVRAVSTAVHRRRGGHG